MINAQKTFEVIENLLSHSAMHILSMFLRGLDAVRRKKIAVKNTAINKFLDNKVSAMADISTDDLL